MKLKQHYIKHLSVDYTVKDYTLCRTPDKHGHLEFNADDEVDHIIERCPNKECESDGFRITEALGHATASHATSHEEWIMCSGHESQKAGSLSCPCRLAVSFTITYINPEH